MRNRIRLLVIALLAVLSLAACGNEGSGTATVNMKQLQQAMLAAAPSLSETASTTGDAADAKETFSYVSDLPYDKVENLSTIAPFSTRTAPISMILLTTGENPVVSISKTT